MRKQIISIFMLVAILYGIGAFHNTILAADDPSPQVTVETIMVRLRLLGLETVRGIKISDNDLRSIAEELHLKSKAKVVDFNKTINSLIFKRLNNFVGSQLKEVSDSVSNLKEDTDASSFQSLFQAQSKMSKSLEALASLPHDVELGYGVTFGSLRSLIEQAQVDIQSMANVSEGQRQVQWRRIYNNSIRQIKDVFVKLRQRPSGDILVQDRIFTDTGLRDEYFNIVLDSLELEPERLTAMNITAEIIYIVALSDTIEPGFTEFAWSRVSNPRGAVIAGSTVASAAMAGEILASMLGQVVGSGSAIFGVSSLVLQMGMKYRGWRQSYPSWLSNHYRELFNRRVAIPLGMGPAQWPEQFQRLKLLVCSAALGGAD